jgi:hypothetical protein
MGILNIEEYKKRLESGNPVTIKVNYEKLN